MDVGQSKIASSAPEVSFSWSNPSRARMVVDVTVRVTPDDVRAALHLLERRAELERKWQLTTILFT